MKKIVDIWMNPLNYLVVLLLLSTASAETLRCPYIEGVLGLPHLRAPSLQRFQAEIAAVLGTENPWQPLYEEWREGGPKHEGSLLRLTIDLAPLDPALRAAIFAPLPDGAGCEEIPPQRAARPARTARFENGVLTYDHEDPTRKVLYPEAFGLPQESRWDGRWYHPLAQVWEWLAPRLAWALPAFPTAPGEEDCNVSETPLSRGGLWAALAPAYNNPLNANGTHCVTTGTANAVRVANVTTGPNVDMGVLLGTATGGGLVFLFAHVRDGGTATYDGYNCLAAQGSGELFFYNDVDGSGTQIGSSLPQVIGNNQGYGCRIQNHVAQFWFFNGTTWSAIGTRGPPGVTLPGGAVAFGLGGNAALSVQQMTWGTLRAPGATGRYLLGR